MCTSSVWYIDKTGRSDDSEFQGHLCACLSLHWRLCSHHSPSTYTPLLPSNPTSPVSSSPGHRDDHWGRTSPPQSWAPGSNTSKAPMFFFVLTATCSIMMLRQDLTPGLAHSHSQHPCMQPHSTLHTINYLYSLVSQKMFLLELCLQHWWNFMLKVKISLQSVNPHTPWQIIQKTRSLGCTPLLSSPKSVRLWGVPRQAPHRLASCWCPFSIHSLNSWGCIV